MKTWVAILAPALIVCTNAIPAWSLTEVNSSTVTAALYVVQGTTVTDLPKFAAIVVDNSSNAGNGIEIYTTNLGQTRLNGLLYINIATGTYQEPAIYIKNQSVNLNGAAAEMRIDATNPDIEMEETDATGYCPGFGSASCTGNAGRGKWEVAVSSDVLQFNVRNSTNTSFTNRIQIRRSGDSSNLGSLAFKANTDSTSTASNFDFIAFRSSETLGGPGGGSGSQTFVLPRGDGYRGQCLTTDGSGTLSWGQPGQNHSGRDNQTAKPACDATDGPKNRGTIWTTEGAAGIKDMVEVCAKDATDTYAWRTIY